MSMTPKDIFGIILRAAGLFILRLSLWLFYDYMLWYRTPNAAMKPFDPSLYMGWGIAYLVLGLYLLAGAPHLLRFAYREPEPEPPESEVEHSEKEEV
jgi:hypothetical protein